MAILLWPGGRGESQWQKLAFRIQFTENAKPTKKFVSIRVHSWLIFLRLSAVALAKADVFCACRKASCGFSWLYNFWILILRLCSGHSLSFCFLHFNLWFFLCVLCALSGEKINQCNLWLIFLFVFCLLPSVVCPLSSVANFFCAFLWLIKICAIRGQFSSCRSLSAVALAKADVFVAVKSASKKSVLIGGKKIREICGYFLFLLLTFRPLIFGPISKGVQFLPKKRTFLLIFTKKYEFLRIFTNFYTFLKLPKNRLTPFLEMTYRNFPQKS